ncbi:hypothetical protein [Pseudomonas mandelii]|uniref:hypothetical protein n=1 Tax=Pseudomonas mandelii TaxID=75612 RepID=UPI0003676660|nr:hypothetical protein [Pseudomonas mandelii]
MSKAEIQTTGFFTEREFTCWRERDYKNFYPCQVSKQEGNYVSLSLGDMSYRFDDTIAEDIARCILDADLVTAGKLYGYIPKPAMRESAFDSWYKMNSSGVWNYFGEGEFSYYRSGGVIIFMERVTDEDDTAEIMGIYTIDDVGIKLVLESSSYSFSKLDAVWLSNALMEALGEEPLDFLKTSTM